MQPQQLRSKFVYKEPRRLNAVSLGFFLILALIGYAGYAVWPAYSLRSNVESELGDALSTLWKLNHNSTPSARREIEKLKRTVTDRLRKVGVEDKGLQVTFEHNRKFVAMQATFRAPFTLPVLDKTVTMTVRPRVQTDAARVEW
jgi:hypothetical protein